MRMRQPMTIPVVVRPPPIWQLKIRGVTWRHILHMAIEDIEDDLFGRLPISEGQPVVLHPVALLLQLIIHLPGSLHRLWTCPQQAIQFC